MPRYLDTHARVTMGNEAEIVSAVLGEVTLALVRVTDVAALRARVHCFFDAVRGRTTRRCRGAGCPSGAAMTRSFHRVRRGSSGRGVSCVAPIRVKDAAPESLRERDVHGRALHGTSTSSLRMTCSTRAPNAARRDFAPPNPRRWAPRPLDASFASRPLVWGPPARRGSCESGCACGVAGTSVRAQRALGDLHAARVRLLI